ncbi:MAG: LysR family transcriptional regulator [Burkholderiaceae bacterium]|nr:MAG: LysR family transcriptional regulator [Burkholderiaceae bacterium]MCC7288719.1 LysR family transcriptional regulator [Burkholderiaceae bacterium]
MKDRLQGMRVFAHVVEAKSFSAAADKLGISKSLASRHVSALERALSVKLLHRSTRRLSLTEAGGLFYEHCARIVQEAQLAEQRLSRAQTEPAGLVKVTAVPAFAVRHVLPALAQFQQQYPLIQVRLFCSNRPVDLGSEGFDLGIRVSFKPPPELVARKLAPNRGVLCASPAYIERCGLPRRVEDLAKHACVLFPALAPKGVWTLLRDGRKVSVPVAGSFETDEMDAVFAAVAAGLGIGALPLYMAADAVRQGRLVPLLRQYRFASESAIYLVYLPNRTLASRVRVLIDFLVARFARTPSWETGW